MTRLAFLKNLDETDSYDYWLDDDDADVPVTVYWYRNGRRPGEDPTTRTRLEWYAVEQNDWPTLEKACKQGRDVAWATRVTGYLSWVGQWNPGKRGELKDRHRTREVKGP